MSNQRSCKYCGHYLADGKHCTCHESFYMRKNAKLQDEITRLQSEVERLRGRLARQNECICAIRNTAINAPNTHNMNWIVEHCDDAISGISPAAWLLRKQAEAVESFGAEVAEGALDQDGESGIDFAHGDVQTIADTYAQRLRQQADEAEKAGG